MRRAFQFALLCWACAIHGPTSAQNQLAYQERPYAFEGIKPRPVSGFDLELLSATIESEKQAGEIGDRLQLTFYLDRQRPAHLVVREIDQRLYYWLDRAKGSWTAGYNTFSWPTNSVLRQLPGVSATDLGVVVRLDKEEPSAIEDVAPALLAAGNDARSPVRGYAFAFKLREDAQLRGTFFDESKGQAIYSVDLGRQRGGRPFAVHWDLTKHPAPAGAYRLVLKGYALATNDPVSQVVRFVHASETK